MPQAQLLLTPVTMAAIRGLVERGHGHRISHVTIKLKKATPERLQVPHGFSLHFDLGYYKPDWLCRHISVQGPGRWPGKDEVRKLMRLAGFNSTLEGAMTWADRSAPRHAVHVLEPLNGDWAPLRSS